jgi:hypothetical protein
MDQIMASNPQMAGAQGEHFRQMMQSDHFRQMVYVPGSAAIHSLHH